MAGLGATQSIDQLYRDHREWLLTWLRRNLHCPHRAEELSQDAFLKILDKQDQAWREPRAFLTTIARGLLIDHFRRSALERRYLDSLSDQEEDVQLSSEDLIEIVEDLQRIDSMLATLSTRARAAFLHHRLDGMSHMQIAEHLGVSVPRVRQYIAQGLRQCYNAVHGHPT